MQKFIDPPTSPLIVVPRPWTAALALFVMLLLVVIGFQPLSEGAKTVPFSGEGDGLRQLAYIAVFGFAFVALRVPQNLRQLFITPVSVVVLLVWCWLSISWSIEPAVATRRLALTTMLIWTAFLCVEHAGFELTSRVMRVVLLITLVLNYLAVAFFPIAVHQTADLTDPNLVGNWRGILTQKNFAGAVCSLLILMFVFSEPTKHRWFKFLVIAAGAYFLYRTFSKTSMGVLAVSLLIGWLYSVVSLKYRKVLLPSAAILAGLGLLLVQEGLFADAFSRPDALTGRVQIWPVLLAYSNDHLLQGSGFGSFWNIGDYSPVYAYTRGWVAGITSGHNGYLDLLVQIGLPGMLLAVFALLIAPFWALVTSSTIPKQQGALLIACLSFCAGHNLTESSMMDRDMILQVFLVITVALTYKLARRSQQSPAFAGREVRI